MTLNETLGTGLMGRPCVFFHKKIPEGHEYIICAKKSDRRTVQKLIMKAIDSDGLNPFN